MSLSPKVMARNWRKNNIRAYIKFLSVQKKSKTGKLTAMWAMTRTQSVTHWHSMSTRSLQLQLKLQLELEGQVLKSDNASHWQSLRFRLLSASVEILHITFILNYRCCRQSLNHRWRQQASSSKRSGKISGKVVPKR